MRISGKAILTLVAVTLVTLTARSAAAQLSGCTDSPEDPTVVMGMLGLSAAAAPMVWTRIKSLRKKK